MAAQTVNAAGEHGVYAYIKHFALNDQETNRCSFLLTYCDEQAIREIYLKPFEECVKNYDYSSKPLAVMSSFNFIGDIYSGANQHLLNNVLDSASCVLALRQASKNIMFTVANSGAYTAENEEGFFTPMNTLFVGIDAAVVIISAGIMAIVLIRWRKKNVKLNK
ncbi:MAG TPA: hypothetical protein H9730_09380 [Candidatus Mediterraneibacter stercoripullorum]|nr:hypothetical protein [Candidatus Mediterraneibacter stercoripullorum]